MTGIFAGNTAQMHAANTIQINIQNLAIHLGAYLTHAIIVDLQVSALEEIERYGAYPLVIHLQIAHSHVANLYGAYTFVVNLHHIALGIIDADRTYTLVGNIQLVGKNLIDADRAYALVIDFQAVAVDRLGIERAYAFLGNLHQIRTGDINLQSILLRITHGRHLESSCQTNLHLPVSIHYLELLLEFLNELSILDGRVIQSNAAFIAVVLCIIDTGNHIHVDSLERLLSQIILRKLQASSHFRRGSRTHTAGTDAHRGKKQSCRSNPNTHSFHTLSILNFLYSDA